MRKFFFKHDIEWVVETGTRHGGSALYFADLLAMKASRGRVISVDVSSDANAVASYETIDFLIADTARERKFGLTFSPGGYLIKS
jgi:cephalosporin hydroxylase